MSDLVQRIAKYRGNFSSRLHAFQNRSACLRVFTIELLVTDSLLPPRPASHREYTLPGLAPASNRHAARRRPPSLHVGRTHLRLQLPYLVELAAWRVPDVRSSGTASPSGRHHSTSLAAACGCPSLKSAPMALFRLISCSPTSYCYLAEESTGVHVARPSKSLYTRSPTTSRRSTSVNSSLPAKPLARSQTNWRVHCSGRLSPRLQPVGSAAVVVLSGTTWSPVPAVLASSQVPPNPLAIDMGNG